MLRADQDKKRRTIRHPLVLSLSKGGPAGGSDLIRRRMVRQNLSRPGEPSTQSDLAFGGLGLLKGSLCACSGAEHERAGLLMMIGLTY